MPAQLNSLVLLAQQPAALGAATVVGGPWYLTWYGVLAILLATLLLSLAAGSWLARVVRIPDYGWKFWLVTFIFLLSVDALVLGWPPKLGIDLLGGTRLVYEIDPTQGNKTDFKMADLIDAVSRRLDPAGVKQVTVRNNGNTEVEVVVPEISQDEVQLIKEIMRQQGHLEFRILANPDVDVRIAAQARAVGADREVREPDADARPSNPTQDYLIGEAKRMPDAAEIRVGKEVRARWVGVPANQVEQAKKDPDLVTRSVGGQLQKLVILGRPLARWVQVGVEEGTKVPRVAPTNSDPLKDTQIVWRPRKDGGMDVLVLIDKQNVDGSYLSSANVGVGDNNHPDVEFKFNSEGARLFETLTGNNQASQGRFRKLGIVLDDVIFSAANLQAVISDSGRITGNFTDREVKSLVEVLRGGSLPAALSRAPVSEELTPATLGADTIRQGVRSVAISLIAILLFMPLYYRFAGVVAGVALLLNLVIVVAVMVAVKAAFTLAGLAGVVLTVGMAVDSNVLIYERLREELDRGAALRMAIRNAFARATRTIVDANVCTLIGGMVLYAIGNTQLKSFAVTLILGIAISMFTAIFCSRLVFDVFEKRRWITSLKMTRLLGHTTIDFMGLSKICVAGSLVVITIGMVALFMRGKDFLDIDFRGGTKIQVVFKGPHDRTKVQEKLDAYNLKQTQEKKEILDGVLVTPVGQGNTNFDVETTQLNPGIVQNALKAVFGDELKTNLVTFDPRDFKTVVAARSPVQPGRAELELPGVPESQGAKNPTPEKSPSGEKTGAAPMKAGQPAVEKPVAPAPVPPKSKEPDKATKPADAKPASKPSDGAGLRADDAGRLLASADPQLVALALAAPAAAVEDTAPAKNPAASPASNAKAAAPAVAGDKPAPPAPPIEQSTGAAKADEHRVPSDAKASDSQPAPAGHDVVRAANDQSPPVADTKVVVDDLEGRYVGGTAANLKFSEMLNQEVLSAKLKEAGETLSAEIKKEGKRAGLEFVFELSNPNVEGASLRSENEWQLKTTLDKEDTARVVTILQRQLASEPAFAAAVNVGGQVSEKTQDQAWYAIGVSIIFIAAYIWIRFQQVRYGLAAIVALVHDVSLTVGLLALSKWVWNIPVLGEALQLEPFKMSLVILAALLTLNGYSLNDTIVVFDRIREMRGKSPKVTPEIINASVNQTLSRTLLTSFTTFTVVTILYFFGGPGVHGFAITMVIGVIVGTYSSIYIASPLLLWLDHRRELPVVRSGRDTQRPAKTGTAS